MLPLPCLYLQLREVFSLFLQFAVEDEVAVKKETCLERYNSLSSNFHMGIVPVAKVIAVIIAVCNVNPAQKTGLAVHHQNLAVIAVIDI